VSGDRGEVVVAGIRFPVRDVRLVRGGVEVTFLVKGPQAPFRGAITVFGEDGNGCWQGNEWDLQQQIPAGEAWECHYLMTFYHVAEQEPFHPVPSTEWPP
jgi:hypothetical protein